MRSLRRAPRWIWVVACHAGAIAPLGILLCVLGVGAVVGFLMERGVRPSINWISRRLHRLLRDLRIDCPSCGRLKGAYQSKVGIVVATCICGYSYEIDALTCRRRPARPEV